MEVNVLSGFNTYWTVAGLSAVRFGVQDNRLFRGFPPSVFLLCFFLFCFVLYENFNASCIWFDRIAIELV